MRWFFSDNLKYYFANLIRKEFLPPTEKMFGNKYRVGVSCQMSSGFRLYLSFLLSFTDKIHKVVFDGQPLRYLDAFAYSKVIVTFML